MKTLRDRSFDTGTPIGRGSRRRVRRGRNPGTAGFDEVLRDHSGMLTFLGLTLGVFVSKKFFMIPLAVAASLGQEYAKERYLTRPPA